MKQWDVLIGAVGAGGTIAFLNTVIGTAIGALTVAVLVLRVLREWRKNRKPVEPLPCDRCPFTPKEDDE